MWDLIVSVPDHCLSFYFVSNEITVHLYILCLNVNYGSLRCIDFFLKQIHELTCSMCAHNQLSYPSNQSSQKKKKKKSQKS